MLKLKRLILEGAYESATRNELAMYIGMLMNQRDHYTEKGNQAMVKLLNSDIDEVKAVLKKKGGGMSLGLKEADHTNDRVTNESVLNREVAAASEILSLLAHPDMKRSMDNLSDVLEDSEFMAIMKLYDGLYAELKKYE